MQPWQWWLGGLAIAATCVSSTAAAQRPTVEDWRADLRSLATDLRARHFNMWHTVSPAAFDSALAELDARLPSLAPHQILVRVQSLLSLVGDGHTTLPLIPASENPVIYPAQDHGFRQIAVRLYSFSGGLFVRAAARPCQDLVGARVVAIGGISVDSAVARAERLASADGLYQKLEIAPFYLAIPEILHALGLSTSLTGARYTVTSVDGGIREVECPVVSPEVASDSLAWRDARSTTGTIPLWLRQPAKTFWLHHDPARRQLYVQINRLRNDPGESFASFSERVGRLLADQAIERVIIDLRRSAGGDATLSTPLLHALIRSADKLPRGSLFVITGRRAFSASMNFLGDLRRHTNAVFVGEPTGGRPNHFGETMRVTLPRTGTVIIVSSRFWITSVPRDNSDAFYPEIAAPLTMADYRANRDPAMEAIERYRARPALRTVLRAAYDSGGIAALLEEYRRVVPVYSTPWPLPVDTALRRVGLEIWDGGRRDDAMRVFDLRVREFPGSAAAHELLAQGFEELGSGNEAISHYRHALALDPRRWDSVDGLRRLTRQQAPR